MNRNISGPACNQFLLVIWEFVLPGLATLGSVGLVFLIPRGTILSLRDCPPPKLVCSTPNPY
jgi:hypothetical protein